MSQLSLQQSSFVQPHFIEALGEEGLTLHEVAQSLDIEFKEAKRVLEKNLSDYTAVEFSTQQEIQEVTGHSYNRTVNSYYLTIEDAKFFVAGYNNETGKAYRRYLIDCERQMKAIQAKAQSNPLALAAASGDMVAFAQLFLETTKAKVEAERLALYSQRALASSQQNTAEQTRKLHNVEAELAQRNLKISVQQFFAMAKIKAQKNPGVYTRRIRETLEGHGIKAEKVFLRAEDRGETYVWPKYVLQDNHDRIVAIVEEMDAKRGAK